MNRICATGLIFTGLLALPVHADQQSWSSALGGALGGGVGAYVGNELGGRDGAIIGGALGGAAGAAVSTGNESVYGERSDDSYDERYYYGAPPPGNSQYFCPPGQAKKGRC